jgi:hypothetical protein
VVQLREAHADADGTQQQLQQERQVKHLWVELLAVQGTAVGWCVCSSCGT